MEHRPVFVMRRFFCCLLLGTLLLGCAAETAYREGSTLVREEQYEAGLDKLRQALAYEPRNAQYRAAYQSARERALQLSLEQAERLAASGKRDDAERMYRRMSAIDPDNERARAGLARLAMDVRHELLLKEVQAALEQKDVDSARRRLGVILAENPNNERARALQRSLAESARPAETDLAAAYRKPITIEFRDASLKQVFEIIARTSGLNFLFDKDVKTDQRSSIFLKNSSVESAVHFMLLTNQLEQQVMDGNTVLIYPNTSAKVKDYQEMVVKTFFLANAEAKAVAATLKTIVKSRDIVVDEKLNMLIVRDSPEAIRIAEKLIALQDVAEPEVMLEVEILEVKRTRFQELGVKWPDSLSLEPLASPLASGVDGTLTLRDLRRNTNSGTLGAKIAPLTVDARKTDGNTNILANPRIRARNHEKAKIMIGERVPTITTTATTGYISESITYVDVGLTLNVEPTVYLDNDVAIKVSLEVSNIVSQMQTKSGSTAYTIGTRSANTVLRLKDGENQVLAGLINDEDRRSAIKVPLLGDVPLIGRLFGSTADDNQKTEIVLSITPHLVRNIVRPEAALAEFRAGTDASLRHRPDSAGAPYSATPPASLFSPQEKTGAVDSGATAPASNGGGNSGTANADGSTAGGVFGNPGVPGAAGTPIIAAQLGWQGPGSVKVGDAFAVQLTMQSLQPVAGVPLTIGIDNKIFEVVSVTEGDFLRQGGAQTGFIHRIDPNGQIIVTATRSGDGGATQPGSVATLNLRALKPASAATVQLLAVSPSGAGGNAIAAAMPKPYLVQVRQ